MTKAPAVDYALQIIEYFSIRKCALGIADISNALNINKNAISRILISFLENGWIYCCDNVQKKYLLTLKPFSIVSKCVNDSTIIKIAKPFLKNLNDSLGDSVYFGVKKEKTVLFLLHYDSTKDVRIAGCIGGEYPLHTAAPGKVLLSWSSNNEINSYFGSDNKEFAIEAARIKKQGYAVDNEEFGKGIICYAAPIFDSDGKVIASIGISSLTIYEDINSLVSEKGKLISECADNISYSLGYDKLKYNQGGVGE